MKIDRIRTDRAAHTHPRAAAATHATVAKRQGKASSLRVRTSLRAGDIYMQWPRGSNNPLP